METTLKLWDLTKSIDIRTLLPESVIKVSNIKNHLYLQTSTNNLYHGQIQETEDDVPHVHFTHCESTKVVDIASCGDCLYLVDTDGNVFKCSELLEKQCEISLHEDYHCSRGHSGTKCKMKVSQIAVGEYGQLFVTEGGQLWASGHMPQIAIDTEQPKKVEFFAGRTVYSACVGSDFAIAIVSKLNNNGSREENGSDSEGEGEENDDILIRTCPQCLSAGGSLLTSPNSQNSISEMGVKVQGSYDIETTSTSSKNDTCSITSDKKLELSENDDEDGTQKNNSEKNIIFRNTEAAKEFLTRQISRMSSAGEEYLVECTEKPTRIIKENMTNVASFVYEGVKTVGDKVVTLSRHVSGSSDCNSILLDSSDHLNGGNISRNHSKDDCMLGSMSQATSERDLSCGGQDLKERSKEIVNTGMQLINCEVWTWGNIIHGQLGIGDIIKRERPMIITKLSNIGVRKVSVQNYHASVLTLDGRAYIWGRNNFNQVTIDSTSDQSSPKLFNKDDRIKDVICGEYYTALLTNNLNVIYFGKESPQQQKNYDLYLNYGSNQSENKIGLFRNLLNSMQYTLFNVNNFVDNFFANFLLDEQKFMEEMLSVHAYIIKPLQKKNANSSNGALYEELCTNYLELLYFWAANVQSLLEHSNGLISLCDILIFKCLDEFMLIYRNYMQTIFDVVSIDGFQQIAKLIEISPNLYKLRPENWTKKERNNHINEQQVIGTFLLAPIDKLSIFTTIIQNYSKQNCLFIDQRYQKWKEFVDEMEWRKLQAEQTRDFWLNSSKISEHLKANCKRRLIRDSNKFAINLQNASRFSSHRFVLFNDLFVHVNSSTIYTHNLCTIWLETQQLNPVSDEQTQNYQIVLKMPEDTLVLTTNEAEDKINWLHSFQTSIKNALNKPEALQPPAIRHGMYTFTKMSFFKDATYTGRWLNGKMHGSGKIEWSDGKIYTGQFQNNQLSGHGLMAIPNVGTYEGNWKDNQQNGYGTFTYINTDVYRGHFKDGQPHGHGCLRKGNFMATAASFYIGDWVNGMKNGYGVMDDILSGEKYIGCWMDNRRQGNGLIITSDGVFYEGVFHQDALTGHGVMILEDGTEYAGEFRGTGCLYGRGTLKLPSGHTIEGTMSGTWDEGIKISNGVLTKDLVGSRQTSPQMKHSNGITISEVIPLGQKWKSLFKHCYQVLGVADANNSNNNNNNKNGGNKSGTTMDTTKIWQNVAVYLSNTSQTLKKDKGLEKHASLNKLDIIPPFGREKLDLISYNEVRNYLSKAFESHCHPLGSLLNDLSEAYMTTYGGRAHPLLLNHAIDELHYICNRLYEIVRILFPALPQHEVLIETDQDEEIVNCQALLYALILPKVHHPLFNLFTLKNEKQEWQYKKKLMEWNKKSDDELMRFLSVDEKFAKNEIICGEMFGEAIEMLQQLKSTFSPTEKLQVLLQTVEKMTPVAQLLLGKHYSWNMDDLFPNFLFVVVRARIPDLGSELDFIDNFMDPSLESGKLGIMYTTLKASYQQIFMEKLSYY